MLAEMMKKLISFLLLHSIHALLDSPSVPFSLPLLWLWLQGSVNSAKQTPLQRLTWHKTQPKTVCTLHPMAALYVGTILEFDHGFINSNLPP